ncbi:hypothetical protein AMJ96_CH02650 [Rhizobium sp. N113]|uniref:hypothetical protein n=1 Tax=unclassified Rhizobium TaxID=2613769 RepID=UPI0007E9C98D|nr:MULTISPECIES: hypothetical protein [unclassified Rhizobium]ANL10298.1 hypothetical protein AMJ98_CH02644 [Rhizobium sp. N1341]ANL22350.1 hypothetical protein AMJ96_CH02650 [Rhizobium sp. N113]ANM41110.1 hypothetical protein AMK03_CH02619 [Rhizobium sp. N741]
MIDYKSSLAVLVIGCTALIAPLHANAMDIGGKNGISVSGSRDGLSVSVGGAHGVDASVGRSSRGGLGVDASVGGSDGIASSTSVSSGRTLLRANTAASIDGSDGVKADVDVRVGGSRSASAAFSRLGNSEDALFGSTLGTFSEDAVSTQGVGTQGVGTQGVGTQGVRTGSVPRSTSMALNEMSPEDKAKAKLRCKDVLSSGGFDASLVKLCKMVVAMR